MTEERKEDEATELEGKWGDKSLRAKSKYMSELLAFLSLILLISATAVGATVGYQHLLDTRERDKLLADLIRERDLELKALFKEISAAQRDMVSAQREQNCLIAIPQDSRFERANLCRGISR